MARIVLIHGYANGLTNAFRSMAALGDFKGFSPLIAAGEAVRFEWYNLYNHNLQQTLSLEANKYIYFQEKSKARDPQTLKELHHFLMEHQPEIIVAFSMGCYLLDNYIKKYSLPECVNNVSFVQADLSFDFDIKDRLVIDRIKIESLVWQNFWCFWDPALSISTFLNKKKRLGLVKSNSRYIKNYFFPLYRHPNLHVSSISDPDLVDKILKVKTIPPTILHG